MNHPRLRTHPGSPPACERPTRRFTAALLLLLALLAPRMARAQYGVEQIPLGYWSGAQLLAADVDGNGTKDLVAAGPSGFRVYRRQTGAWTLSQDVGWMRYPWTSNDRIQLLPRYGTYGPLDLLAIGYYGYLNYGIWRYENNGSGSFSSADYHLTGLARLPGAVVNFASVGPRLVIATFGGGPGSAGLEYLSFPIGVYTTLTNESTPGLAAFHVGVTDLNQDGKSDMWLSGQVQRGPNDWPAGAAYRTGNGVFGGWSSWLDLGAGHFGGDANNPPEVLDLNQDGLPDLIAGMGDAFQANPSQFGGLRQRTGLPPVAFTGTLGIAPRHRWATDYNWGDVNEDGYPDLVTLSLARSFSAPPNTSDSTGFEVWLGQPNGESFTNNENTIYDVWNTHVDAVAGQFDVSLADFDGDGHLDVAMLMPGRIDVFHGFGDGTFDAAPSGRRAMLTRLSGVSGRVLGLCDLDMDGLTDLIIGSQSSTKSLLMASVDTTTSSIVVRSSFDAGPVVTHIARGRLFDWNGKPEVVLGRGAQRPGEAGYDSGLWFADWMFSDLDGGSGLGETRGLAVRDLDGNGYDDVVLTSPGLAGDHYEVAAFAAGSTWFPWLSQSFEHGTGITGCAVAALDANPNVLSLVTLFDGGHAVAEAHGVQYGSELGQVYSEPLAISPLANSPHPFEVAALRGPGQPQDIVVAQSGASAVRVLRGTGIGTGLWTDGTEYDVAGLPAAVAVGDLNRDTRPDVAVACNSPEMLTVYLTDASGALVNRQDIRVYGQPPLVDVRIGDINNDGRNEVVFLTTGSLGAAASRLDRIAANGDTTSTLMTLDFEDSLPALVGVEDSGPHRGGGALELSVSPNPVRERTRFSFTLPEAAAVRLELFDVTGRRVAVLADATFPAGRHTLTLPADRLNASRGGVYFARLDGCGVTINRRLVVLQ